MKIKVVFSNRDEILAAVVRALAVQAAGFQVVGGMNKNYLIANGFFLFDFESRAQINRFKTMVRDYVPANLQTNLKIEEDSKLPTT
jgi:hypothetical protein